jgi:hypothetical protein
MYVWYSLYNFKYTEGQDAELTEKKERTQHGEFGCCSALLMNGCVAKLATISGVGPNAIVNFPVFWG